MSLPALYELANQYHSLAMLADTDDLPPEAIRDTLDSLEGDIDTKAVNIAKFVLGLEAEADAIEAAAKKMQQRAERRKRRAESVRAYMLFQLQQIGKTKVNALEFTISVRKNPEALEVNDPDKVPPEFMITPDPPLPRPDKAALKEALKAGREIPGVWLRQSERLEIRA